jgi:branched-chain amino acid transport system permease protein
MPRLRILGGILVAGGLLAAPAFLDSYFQHVLILIFYTAYLSTSWNILGGYAGQLSIGHAAFLGVGAYTSTMLLAKFGLTPWLGMWIGAAAALALAYFIGFLSFRYRLRGAYFTLATIAFAEIMRLIAIHVDYTGGAFGMMVQVTENTVFNFVSTEKRLYYYTILTMLTLLIIIVWRFQRSKTGIYCMAIREDEDAAECSGVETTKYKMRAMLLSGGSMALGGTFYAQYVTFIDPDTVFGVLPSVEMLLPAIVGGAGTLFGPVLGAFFLVPLSEATKAWFTSFRGIHLLIYGAVLILFLRFFPGGLMRLIERLTSGRRKSFGGAGHAATPTE